MATLQLLDDLPLKHVSVFLYPNFDFIIIFFFNCNLIVLRELYRLCIGQNALYLYNLYIATNISFYTKRMLLLYWQYNSIDNNV